MACEAVCRRSDGLSFFGWVVSIGLTVGDVAIAKLTLARANIRISHTDRLVLSLHMASSCLESAHAVFYRISAIVRVWTFSQSSYPERRPWKVYFHEARTVHLTHKEPSSFRCLELGNPKHMPGIGGASWRISLVGESAPAEPPATTLSYQFLHLEDTTRSRF